MRSPSRPDYLVIGHISRDLTAAGPAPGGTATYAAHTARVLGCRPAVVTSAGPEFDLERLFDGIEFCCRPAAQTTTFENHYLAGGRRQMISGRAADLSLADVPLEWRQPAIVHLGPIANEVDANLVTRFGASLIGLTPQGWLRQWAENGRVSAGAWPEAAAVLPLAAAAVLSEEDVPDPAILRSFRHWAPLLVVTRGAVGCDVYLRGEKQSFFAPAVRQVNPTGAGDIFAAAFFIRLRQTGGNPWEAAAFANRLAAQSTTQNDLAGKMVAMAAEVAQVYGA